jgi:hypothetical protein
MVFSFGLAALTLLGLVAFFLPILYLAPLWCFGCAATTALKQDAPWRGFALHSECYKYELVLLRHCIVYDHCYEQTSYGYLRVVRRRQREFSRHFRISFGINFSAGECT